MLATLEKRCANNASIQCPDSDNDGIQDWIDICPLQPETKNGITDDDGCPKVDQWVKYTRVHCKYHSK